MWVSDVLAHVSEVVRYCVMWRQNGLNNHGEWVIFAGGNKKNRVTNKLRIDLCSKIEVLVAIGCYLWSSNAKIEHAKTEEKQKKETGKKAKKQRRNSKK